MTTNLSVIQNSKLRSSQIPPWLKSGLHLTFAFRCHRWKLFSIFNIFLVHSPFPWKCFNFTCKITLSVEQFRQYWLPLNTRPKKKHFFSGKLSHVGKNLCCCAYLSLWKLVLLAKHIPSFSRYNATHTLWKYIFLMFAPILNTRGMRTFATYIR